MKNEKALERIYDLVETTDFNELNDEDKKFVLQHISSEEYITMRRTIADTKDLFSKYPDDLSIEKPTVFKKIVTLPVQLYKVAVVILLITGTYIVLNNFKNGDRNKLLATIDTVYIKQIDTFVVNKIETVERIREKIIYTDKLNAYNSQEIINHKYIEKETVKDCPAQICPDDIQSLTILKGNNSLSEDESLSYFVTSIK